MILCVGVMSTWCMGCIWLVGRYLLPLAASHPLAQDILAATFSLVTVAVSPIVAWAVLDRRREWWARE